MSKYGNTVEQNLFNTAKTVLRNVSLSIYIRKKKNYEYNDLNYSLKMLEKENQIKPKESRREKIRKVRVEINKIR